MEISSSIAQIGDGNVQNIHLRAANKSRLRWLAVILAVPLGLAVTVAAAWAGFTAASRGNTGAVPAVVPSATQAPRLLANWVAEVNRACKPVLSQVQAVKPAEDAPVVEQVAGLKKAADVYKRLIGELNAVPPPTDPQDKAKSSDWTNTYNDWYRKLLSVIVKLDAATEGGPWSQLIATPTLNSAYSELKSIGIDMKTKGDILGIACPGMTI